MAIFEVGMRVRFLEETGTGKILEIRGSEALVADAYGFADWHALRSILPLDPPPASPVEAAPEPPKEVPKTRVRFVHEPGTGEILDRKGDEVLVATSAGFQIWVPKTEIIELDATQEIQIDAKELAAIRKAELNPRKLYRKKAADNRREIDLHIHELLETTRGMSKHALYEFQMGTAQEALFEARRSGIKFLVLIHGKGKGKLRQGLMEWLETQERLAFYDASYAKYGGGALEVQLF